MEGELNDTALGLDIELDDSIVAVLRPGRRPAKLNPRILREVRESDLMLLMTDAGTQPEPLVRRLSERHHALARLLAAGASQTEAAMVVGYDPPRVSILLGSPAFKELVEHYRQIVTGEFAETMGQIAGFSKDVLLELRERLEADPSAFSNEELRRLLTDTLDRSGFGPTHKQETTVTISLSERLESARKRALEARRQEIIDITPNEAAE